MRQEGLPPHVKRKIDKMIVQPAMLYGNETLPMTSSHAREETGSDKNEVVHRWACGHTLRYEQI